MAPPAQMTPMQQAARARQMNLAARGAVLSNSVEMIQQIFSNSYDPTTQTVVNVQPRNVGLIKGFIVKVNASLTTGATGTANRTGMGAMNLLSNIMFQDLNNLTRINTPGWHIGLLNSARMGFGYGGAYAPNLPNGIGNNWTVQSGPSTIAVSTAQALTYYYYVPLAYSADDLSGAIFANVINSQMNLQLTINSNPIINTGDPLNAVYSGNNATTGWTAGNAVTITVYQVFLDQLPQGKNGQYILPPIDLATIYGLQQTALTGLSAGQDFPLPYANFRNFLSTFAIYDNAGTYNVGSDINNFALQAANTTNFWKVDPYTAALMARYTFMADPPPGVYYFDHRRHPVNTTQFGNTQLVVNPISVGGSTAQVLMATEALYAAQQITQAASLAAG